MPLPIRTKIAMPAQAAPPQQSSRLTGAAVKAEAVATKAAQHRAVIFMVEKKRVVGSCFVMDGRQWNSHSSRSSWTR
jgi:hypothetical protein